MLTVDDVAAHYGLRREIRSGRLAAIRINRNCRLDWEAVWACEDGRKPTRATAVRCQAPLLSRPRGPPRPVSATSPGRRGPAPPGALSASG